MNICISIGHGKSAKGGYDSGALGGSIPVYLFDAYAYDNHPIYLVNIDRNQRRLNI